MTDDINPTLLNWNGPLGLPEYDKFTDDDFEAAFEYALPRHLAEIDAIADNSDAPTFENVIEALELSGEELSKVSAIFWNLTGSCTNDTLQALERKLAPEMAEHQSKITMNAKLFNRVDAVYEQRDSLDLNAEAFRVLEKTWKGFARSGAKLEGEKQTRLAEVNQRLAMLGTNFAQNMLADESDYSLIIEDEGKLAGLPDFLLANMAMAAEEKGHKGKHAVTLSRSIIEPFLAFSSNRELREETFKAWVARGEHEGDKDNRPIVRETVKLRAEKAALLGYENFAAFKLDDTMAKTAINVSELLQTVWKRAKAKAAVEAKDLAELIAGEGKNHSVAPWDWRYYSEKMRTERYSYNEAEVKAYFQLDKMVDAAFDTAGRLFGISFKEHFGIAAYHENVRVFEVFNADGKQIAIFLADYFARSSKRSGAWMSGLEHQHKLGEGAIPIILNTMNFAKAPEGEPVLISMTDAKTLFHEFGHALHGMLSNVTYPSVSGTSVARDFVELPSQLFEHWLTVPEILTKYAVRHDTGEPLPNDLLAKVLESETFNSGFENVEFTSSALVDMEFHALDEKAASDVDPMAFQNERLAAFGMPSEIVMRHATPHFAHVFAGDGYSAGYYSYMWSGVLDADAFRAFEETGDAFDAETAGKLLRYIYSSGGSMDPEDAYKAFRGSLPNPDALLKQRGLKEA
ncbi:MAG: M3 family metallopeptidase [Rhizobiaceae bacterium]|nr:M3 family metallopeptidase [Rhizobiaceae bacterium]